MKHGYVGRFDVLDNPVGRRTWPDDVKARIVVESYAPGARVADVARRHRLLPSQVTGWRRLARMGKLALPVDGSGLPTGPEFIPLMLDAAMDMQVPAAPIDERIEVDVAGVVIRLPGTMTAGRLAEIVTALRPAKA